MDLAELIDLDGSLREAAVPYIPRFRYILDNINRTDIETLLDRELTAPTRVMLTTLKLAPGNPDMFAVLELLRSDLGEILTRPTGARDLRLVLTYIMSVGETNPAEIEKFADQLGPRAKETFVTTAERLTAEAERRAEIRGEARGQARGRIAVLLQQLTAKFGSLPQYVVERVQSGDAEQLQSWSVRILTAEQIEQVFS